MATVLPNVLDAHMQKCVEQLRKWHEAELRRQMAIEAEWRRKQRIESAARAAVEAYEATMDGPYDLDDPVGRAMCALAEALKS